MASRKQAHQESEARERARWKKDGARQPVKPVKRLLSSTTGIGGGGDAGGDDAGGDDGAGAGAGANSAATARLWLHTAQSARRARDFVKAFAALDAALALRPRYAQAHFERGKALLDSGRPSEAVGQFEVLLSMGGKGSGRDGDEGDDGDGRGGEEEEEEEVGGRSDIPTPDPSGNSGGPGGRTGEESDPLDPLEPSQPPPPTSPATLTPGDSLEVGNILSHDESPPPSPDDEDGLTVWILRAVVAAKRAAPPPPSPGQPGCEAVEVGSNHGKEKTVCCLSSPTVQCPALVDRDNWLGDDAYEVVYGVTVSVKNVSSGGAGEQGENGEEGGTVKQEASVTVRRYVRMRGRERERERERAREIERER